jgi:PAS domain S-box-containing protein
MQKKQLASWLTWAIFAVIVVVIAFGYVAHRNITRVRESEALVTKSNTVREIAHKLLSSIKGMEAGQRGFLLTSDRNYLETYHTGLKEIENEFSQLKGSTQSSEQQQSRISKIADLVEQKKKHLTKAIEKQTEFIEANATDVKQTAHNEAIDVMLSGRGKEITEDIHCVVGELLADEAEQLKIHEADADTQADSSKRMIIAGNLLTLALLLTSGFVARLDRKKRDEANAELEAVFKSSPEGIITFDDQLKIRMINPAAARIHQCEQDSTIGLSLTNIIPERMRETVVGNLNKFFESNEAVKHYESQIACRFDGSEFPFDGTLQKSAFNSKPFYTLMIQDLSALYSTAEKIQEQTEILEQVRDAIFVCDLDDKITFWNKGAQELFGFKESEATGKDVTQLLFANQPETWIDGKPVLAQKGIYTDDFTLVSKKGNEIIVEQRRSVIRNQAKETVAQLVISTDVTERKRQEASERRAQRMESIGTLSGGIAHDLNNMLTPILMNAKLLKRGRGDSEKLAGNIVLSAQRGSELISKLLSFAGGTHSSREKIDLKEIVGEAHEILQHSLPKTIELSLECESTLHPVAGDPTELSQVIMNLAINSRDAMPNGGRLELKARNFDVDKRRAEWSDNLKAGPHVLVAVSDEGMGIPRDIIDRIFDPFFSTKEQGKGTGLGLATSLGIVRRHGGEITVYSEVGSGTNFSILLPATTMIGFSPPSIDSESIEDGNGKTILLVDDEAMVLDAAQATLEASGYQVFTATHGAEAIARLQHTEENIIDLVVLDMMMPGLDGVQTRDGIRAFNDIPIIASSGLRRPGQRDSEELENFEAFLHKPYTDEQLLRIVSKVLKKAEHRKRT